MFNSVDDLHTPALSHTFGIKDVVRNAAGVDGANPLTESAEAMRSAAVESFIV